MEQNQTIEQKVQAIEQQIYITYLQINSLVKILAENKIINPDELLSNMDELNKSLYEASQEVGQEVGQEEGQ